MCYTQVSSPGLADPSLKNEPEIDATGYIFYKNEIQLDTQFTKTRYNWTSGLQKLDTIGHLVYKTRCDWIHSLQKLDATGYIVYKTR